MLFFFLRLFLLIGSVFLWFAGTVSTKSLPMVIMQHASFLYRQRTLRGLRSTIKTTTASASSWRTISSTQVRQSSDEDYDRLQFNISLLLQTIRNTAVPHTLLPRRSKKSCTRSLCSNMSSLLEAGNAGHRTVRLGSSDRWVYAYKFHLDVFWKAIKIDSRWTFISGLSLLRS